MHVLLSFMISLCWLEGLTMMGSMETHSQGWLPTILMRMWFWIFQSCKLRECSMDAPISQTTITNRFRQAFDVINHYELCVLLSIVSLFLSIVGVLGCRWVLNRQVSWLDGDADWGWDFLEERRGFDATLTKKRPLYDNLEQQCLFDRFDQSFAFKSFVREGRVSFEQMLLSRWRNNQWHLEDEQGFLNMDGGWKNEDEKRLAQGQCHWYNWGSHGPLYYINL